MKEHFSTIIGQGDAKERLMQSVRSAKNGGDMLSPLLIAHAGNGKTKLANAYCDAIDSLGDFNVLRFSTPQEFRLGDNENYENIVQLFQSPKRGVLFIDEIHEIDVRKTVRLDRIKSFFMKALDENNYGRAIRLDDDNVVRFDPKRFSVVLATNFPEKLDKSGAFQSRLDKLELDFYSEGELRQILRLMLESKGFKNLNEETIGIIARCGRGTARPMEKIVKQISMAYDGSNKRQKTVSREDVIHAIKLSKLFPRGLNASEVQMLNVCGKTPKRDTIIRSMMPNLESQSLAQSKGYLLGCGFMEAKLGGVQTTQFGKKYLDEINKEGFEVRVMNQSVLDVTI